MSKKIQVECPNCHNFRPLSPHDARRAIERGSVCRICHSKKCYQITAGRYGADFALDAIAYREANNPSRPEMALRIILDSLGIDFEAQVKFKTSIQNFVLDAVFTNRAGVKVVVECNGYHHKLFGQLRDRNLTATWDGVVEFIDADDITARPSWVAERLMNLFDMTGAKPVFS